MSIGMKNTSDSYGMVAILLHWLVAVTVFGLFFLGLWMTGLTYYDEWYKRGPDLHKSIGICLFFVMLIRVFWRCINIKPVPAANVAAWQNRAADHVHMLLYVFPFALIISGYLISTADGRSIDVFGLFSIPAALSHYPNQEDIAGMIHWYLALGLIGLSVLHVLAALKHHFFNKDQSLKRMLGISSHNKI